MLSQDQLEKFNKDGYLILENFLSIEQCDKLKNECENIIESNHFVDDVEKIGLFKSADADQSFRGMYFLTSTDKIRPFLEDKAKEILNQDGKSKKIFNKIGHALHALNPVFKEVTFQDKVQQIYKSLNFKNPIVCQSMYIFKQPFIGGEVRPHQDGSYLHTEPLENKVVGVWIALEDCTLDNGCLQFVPGSHRSCPLVTRLVRNPNKEEFEKGKFLIYTKDTTINYRDDEYVTADVKRGDAILIDGLVVHRSSANNSPNSRHIYTFHVYDSEGCTFSSDNWMEPSPISFLPLYSSKEF